MNLNILRARHFAAGSNGYEGVTHAGIAIVAADTGLVLVAQRSYDESDAPEVRETWEWPGGGLDEGEEPFTGAVRELIEETGWGLPDDSTVVNGWRSDDGVYQLFVVRTAMMFPLDGWTPTDEVQAVAWIPRKAPRDMQMRPEIANFDWSVLDAAVSGNEEDQMPEDVAAATQVGTAEDYLRVDEETGDTIAEVSTEEAMMEEPTLTMADVALASIPIHGVLAPEESESGDKRGFTAGAVTARPYRLPFMWQEKQTSGHDNSGVVGSVDRLMRKDGLIHWQGALMPTEEAGKFAELLAFFGRFGVSVDGDKGSLDEARSDAEGMVWFDAVRAAGLTAVAIPAFSEAYVAFGQHPEMPEEESEEFAVLAASGDLVTFDRGPGWVTHPRETKRIHDYWTKPGQPGYIKVGWGTPGDFTRARRLIGEKIGVNSPEDMRYLNQIIAQWHHDALGYWPGELGKPGNAPNTPENRRRAATHAASEDDLYGDYEQAIEESDAIETDETGAGWEAVLVSSAGGGRVTPPAHYFTRHPDTGATVIEEPDENGIRRTYGYAGEWGICHLGIEGRCVEVPDPGPDADFADFHLGRTKVSGNGETAYINTGVVTYKVDHRAGQRILTETAEQQHFDNIAHAWASVRLGRDERGVWFSGVVLPTVSEEDIVLIEAAGQVSGEWKYGELRALQSVNVPGFAVHRDDEGEVELLVASTFGNTISECEPTPAERMAALATIDAEVRFEALKAGWS